ncbi:MAG: tRNA lysidine(34) synthetase TilS, partial [Clostridiales bacterium]|nr:tRNA lysidine(34) synthetase TilS [Clostridiales bacterium]
RHDIRLVAESNGISLEEAGRNIRYEQLEAYAGRLGAQRIALAHNRNDQAETVLMNIIRGTGIKGLSGIDHVRGRIIRPLLDINRSEIEEYCRQNGITPRTDSTNLKNDFTRNRIRLDLIPYMNNSFSTDMTENLCRLSSLARLDNGFMETAAEEAYLSCLAGETKEEGNPLFRINGQSRENIQFRKNVLRLKAEELLKLDPALVNRVIRIAAGKAAGTLKGIGMNHILEIVQLTASGRTGSRIELPGGLRAGFEYGILEIYKIDEKENQKQERLKGNGKTSNLYEQDTGAAVVLIPGSTYVPEFACTIVSAVAGEIVEVDKSNKMGYNSLVQFFDYDSLKMGINIRHRQEGDLFKPYLSGGTKKLKEFFIDEKIPRDIRNRIPLVTCGKDVVWIIGYRISDKYKVTNKTEKVLRLECSFRRQDDWGI